MRKPRGQGLCSDVVRRPWSGQGLEKKLCGLQSKRDTEKSGWEGKGRVIGSLSSYHRHTLHSNALCKSGREQWPNLAILCPPFFFSYYLFCLVLGS